MAVEQPLDPNQVYYDYEQQAYTTVAIEQQLAPFRAKYPNAQVSPILVQTTTSEGDYVPTGQLDRIDIVQQSDRPGIFTRIQLDTSGRELGRTQFQQQGFFQSPVFGILMSAVVPGLGEYIGSALSASGALSTQVANSVGNALAKISVDVALGKDLSQAVRDVAVSSVIQAGSVDIGQAIQTAISDPTIANAILSAGTSAVQTAARGGDAGDMLRAAVAGVGGAITGEAAGQRVPGEVVKTLIATGDPGAAVGAGLSGAVGAVTRGAPTTSPTPTPTPTTATTQLEDEQTRLAGLVGDVQPFGGTPQDIQNAGQQLVSLAEGSTQEAFFGAAPILIQRLLSMGSAGASQLASSIAQLAETPAGQNALRYAAQNSEQVRNALVNTGFMTAGALYLFTAGQPLNQARIAGQFFDALNPEGRDRAEIPTGAPGLTPPTAPPTGLPGKPGDTVTLPGAGPTGDLPSTTVPGSTVTTAPTTIPGRTADVATVPSLTLFAPGGGGAGAAAGGEGGGQAAGGTVTGGDVDTTGVDSDVTDLLDAVRRLTTTELPGATAAAGSPLPGRGGATAGLPGAGGITQGVVIATDPNTGTSLVMDSDGNITTVSSDVNVQPGTTVDVDKTTNTVVLEPYIAPATTPQIPAEPTTTPTQPTVAPTIAPTVEPTIEPVVEPAVQPTIAPTVAPTVKPTVAPTVVPTVAPTVEPTVQPTVAPTVEPTVVPTVEPEVEPTVKPIPSVSPTVTVTIKPTGTTKVTPTVVITMAPIEPTPTLPPLPPQPTPTIEPPTPTPTPTPTPAPTPTVEPTVEPTVKPTGEPTVEPTKTPTTTPTQTTEPTISPFVAVVPPTPRQVTSLRTPFLRSPLEQALSAYTPPGEIEYGTLGPRRDVWNEASLRLKDALGL